MIDTAHLEFKEKAIDSAQRNLALVEQTYPSDSRGLEEYDKELQGALTSLDEALFPHLI